MMNYHIRGLRHIRPHLTVNQASQLGCSIVFSRLDYCNSVLHGTSAHNLNKLQRVQNNLARVVLNERLRTSASPLLQRLHWLPVEKRIDYKIAVLTYKLLETGIPSYLRDTIIQHQPIRALRSSAGRLLDCPLIKTSSGSKAFHSAAPRIWNNLTASTRNSESLSAFKRKLKTDLFTAAYLT